MQIAYFYQHCGYEFPDKPKLSIEAKYQIVNMVDSKEKETD